MGARAVVSRLSDLLPDVMIEAQRVDKLTAEKALLRVSEDLAYQHDFFRAWVSRKYDKDTPLTEGTNARVFHVDEGAVLRVLRGRIDGRPFLGKLFLEEGHVFALGEHWKQDGGDICFQVAYMPMVDEELFDPSVLTRDRSVIVYGTLADLFLMSGKAWSDESRGMQCLRKYQGALEAWKSRNAIGTAHSGSNVAINPFGYL